MTKVRDCIIALLEEGWTSRADAFREVGSLDLPKRVSELRREGIAVEVRTVKAVNRFGRTIKYNEYRIKKDD